MCCLSALGRGGGYLLFHFRSIIGVSSFNFSVRNGKRWSPCAMATLVSFLSVLSSGPRCLAQNEDSEADTAFLCFNYNFSSPHRRTKAYALYRKGLDD